MAVKNITPKFSLKSAESELTLPYGESVMGENVGGLSTYANSFRRGSGNSVFGSDSNGIWLGAADFADAPFSVSMDGVIITKATDGTGSIEINSTTKTIIINDGSNDRVLIGYQENGF